MTDRQEAYLYVFLWAAIGGCMVALMSKRWEPQFDRFVQGSRLGAVAFMAFAWPLLVLWLLFLELRYRATGSPVPAWPGGKLRSDAGRLERLSRDRHDLWQMPTWLWIPLVSFFVGLFVFALVLVDR